MKKVFITGGAGYVGSELVQFFLDQNFKVCVYDTMYFGSDHLPKSQNLKIIQGDIRDTEKLKKSCFS
jgi:UDP-N-acetylglucosamine 4-epimerase